MIVQPFSFLQGSAGGGGCAPIQGATSEVINNFTSQTNEAMANNYYNRSLAAFIIRSSELGTAKQITDLGFRHSGGGVASWDYDQIVIKMAHTSDNTFSLGTINGTFPQQDIPGVTTTDELKVFDNSKTLINTTNWQDIGLTDNFCYNGTDNVVVMICSFQNPADYTFSYYTWKYSGDTSTGSFDIDAGIYYENDNNSPTAIVNSGQTTSNAVRSSFRTNIRIKY